MRGFTSSSFVGTVPTIWIHAVSVGEVAAAMLASCGRAWLMWARGIKEKAPNEVRHFRELELPHVAEHSGRYCQIEVRYHNIVWSG